MPPKGKGKKKKKSRKKKDDGGEAESEVLTFKEAVMMHQLELKKLQLTELQEDVDDQKSRIVRQKLKNGQLIKEQNQYIKEVIKQAREHARAQSELNDVAYEEVERELGQKLNDTDIQQKNVEEIRIEAEELKKEVVILTKELYELQVYKDEGQHIDRNTIAVLQREMIDMENSYNEMSHFFGKSFANIKHTISKQNDANLVQQKHLALEKVLENLQKPTEQEILDNKWLLKEVNIHRQHAEIVSKEVEELEQYNINLMSLLFKQQHANRIRVCYGKEDEEQSESESDEESCEGEISSIDYFTEWESLPTHDEYSREGRSMKLMCVVGTKATLHPGEGALPSHEQGEYKKWNADQITLLE